MTRNKKIFIFAFVVFAIIMAVIAYDIASRTTFPGSKQPDSSNVENNGKGL